MDEEIVQAAMAWLEPRRDPDAAAAIAAYMKIAARNDPNPPMGVKKPELRELTRELKRRFKPADEPTLLVQVRALWAPPWREPKYLALDHARAFQKKLLTSRALPVLERLVREGAWWDLVDSTAAWLVSPLYLRERAEVRPTLDRWRASEDMWLRRSVLLAHLEHGEHTDSAALFEDIEALTHEKELFIRKAIGWVLRDLSYARPDEVKAFLLAHRGELSGLSFREGAKQLVRSGQMTV